MKYLNYSRKKPIWAKTRLEIKCDYCNELFWEARSKIKKSKKHFCSMKCYCLFRKEKAKFYEQPNYRGVRKNNEPKWIYSSRYRKSHPEIISHLKARRYAKEKNAEGYHTLEEWESLKKKYKYKCAECGERKKLTKDHIKPLSLGGSDFIENIQPLCRNCNSKKWKTYYENKELIK